MIILAPLVAIPMAIIFQRKIHNPPLQKKRKNLLILLGILIVFMLIIVILSHFYVGKTFFQDMSYNVGAIILFLLFFLNFFYSFFDVKNKTLQRKQKKLFILIYSIIAPLLIIFTIYLTQEMSFELKVINFVLIFFLLLYVILLFFHKSKKNRFIEKTEKKQ